MNISPLGDRIVVERLEAEDVTSGGIVLPDSAKEKPKEGRVISTGPGKILDSGERSQVQVKKGDRVLFTAYAGTEVDIEGKEYMVMREEDVLAIIKDA